MKSLLILATAALATAESSVVSLFLPGVEGTALVASIIATSADTTTYSINCPPGTDGNDCGVSPGMFLTSGPKKVEYSISEPAADFYGRMICSMGGTTTATCTEIASGSAANFPGTQTSTLASSDITSLPVTITAGPTTKAGGSGTSASETTTESSESSSATETSASGSGSGSGSASSEMASSTSTGGMAQITSAPVLAFGAAVAFVAGAL